MPGCLELLNKDPPLLSTTLEGRVSGDTDGLGLEAGEGTATSPPPSGSQRSTRALARGQALPHFVFLLAGGGGVIPFSRGSSFGTGVSHLRGTSRVSLWHASFSPSHRRPRQRRGGEGRTRNTGSLSAIPLILGPPCSARQSCGETSYPPEEVTQPAGRGEER